MASIRFLAIFAVLVLSSGAQDLTQCALRPGDQARPLLVSDVLSREYGGALASSACSARIDELHAALATDLPNVAVCENARFKVCDLAGVWRMCEMPPPVYTAGKYTVTEKESIGLAALVLESAVAQKVVLRIRDFGRMRVYVNGRLAAKTEACRSVGGSARSRQRNFTHEHGGQWRNGKAGEHACRLVPLTLEKGTNAVVFARVNIGRFTSFSFACSLESAEASVRATLPGNLPHDVREGVAQSRAATYLEDDVWRLGETPRLHVGALATAEAKVEVEIRQEGRKIDAVLRDEGEGWRAMPSLKSAASYAVRVVWKAKDGQEISSANFPFRVFAPFWKPDPGAARFTARRQKVLEALGRNGEPLALYRLGRAKEIAPEPILGKCRAIARMADCADFELLPLLWLAWEDRTAHKLPKSVTEAIRKAALAFRYWVDEPGETSMYYCSENHRIGFHVCEYLAGVLYPKERFSCSGESGLYHSLKGRMHLMEWLSQRCKFGFDEPLSDAYMPVTLTALLALHDTVDVDEYPIRNMTTALLDFMTYTFAVASFDGGLAAPRSRSYDDALRSRLRSGASGVLWLLFGRAPGEGLARSLACSLYRPPEGVLELADGKDDMDFTFRQGLMHFDKHNADFVLRRTPDYFIGGVREHNEGLRDMHFTPAYICLKRDIPIFFQACDNAGSGSGFRPNYWAGNAALPRVLPHHRTLVAVWHDVANRDILFTHCHFPRRRFDEVVHEGGWTLGRSEKGYVGVWSDVPHAFATSGDYAFRELQAKGREVVWLAECGSESEDGSFSDFRRRLLAGAPRVDAQGMTYVSPKSGKIEVGRKKGFRIDGREVPIAGAMADSPHFHANYGGGRFEFKCPRFNWTEWTYPATE